nr:zinc finger A20 and AN1 domain-containing stress-associated protein 1-like [Tanacetum cinerariifolium]
LSSLDAQQTTHFLSEVLVKLALSHLDSQTRFTKLGKKMGSNAAVAKPDVSKEVIKVKVTNRCFDCNKKVGLMGFKCRCVETFCGMHRYPEEHMCEFDYKKTGRELISKANPVVRAVRGDKANPVLLGLTRLSHLHGFTCIYIDGKRDLLT